MIKKLKIATVMVMLCFSFAISSQAYATDPFFIKDVKINGLQRITAGAVFNGLTIKVGDQFTDGKSAGVIRDLYNMGFFSDITLDSDADTLIINVVERPAIASLDIDGAKDVQTEKLIEVFKDIGLAVGKVYNPLILDKVKNELLQQSYNNGKYAAVVETHITNLDRNRVAVQIEMKEGDAASIKKINIVGNKAFDDETILDQFELTGPGLFTFYTDSDMYSKQKLTADLESLSSFYQDRGHINFKVESTQVSISPDKNGIYITINVNEGKLHKVSEVKLAGELILSPDKLIPSVIVQPDDVFSRRRATQTSEKISKILGHAGYSFANVNMIPEIDEETATVKVTFFVDPGKRVYVRRVNLQGNTKTRDEVLRREIMQMEAAPISTANIESSKSRLSRLGHFDEVDVETLPVPGTTDQVDIKYTVKEKSSGNILLGAGFSQSQGIVLNANISQNNFLGTGKRMSLGFNNSDVNTVYSLAYTNPYYTLDGVSRGFNISYRTTDAEEANTSSYTTDSFIMGVNFGIPLRENERINFGMDIELLELDAENSIINSQVNDFIEENGNSFTNFKLSTSWRTDTRNRAVFATKGGSKRVSALITVPGSDLEFYKLAYNQKQYFQVSDHTTLYLNADFGYGDSYGNGSELPFYENYYAGGKGSVRGFTGNTLGPRSTDGLNDPIGGNIKIVGNAEFIFPMPLMPESKTVRLSAFVDAGNVFDDSVDMAELRYSVGVSAKWLSPFGALSISLAKPLNDESDDELEAFQFSFGSGI